MRSGAPPSRSSPVQLQRPARSRLRRASRCSAADASALPARLHHAVVHKFGGSSIRDAERLREVGAIVTATLPLQPTASSPLPVVVLSAMGKTTNALLAAGDAALRCDSESVASLPELAAIVGLHRRTAVELQLPAADVAEVEALLTRLLQLLTGASLMGELSPRTASNLVSFGERLATRLFAAHLRQRGYPARQFDSFSEAFGLVSTDGEFDGGEVLEESYGAVRAVLDAAARRGEVAVVTGFLARGRKTGAITTLGRGGSDLTATVVGRALGVPEVWVWKDVDGILSADPRIVPHAQPLAVLSFDEASELAYFGAQVLHPKSMEPCLAPGVELCVRVRNSYRPELAGTIINRVGATAEQQRVAPLTSIVCKADVTLLDVVSTKMLGQSGFLSKVFAALAVRGVSVDVVATSEVSVSLTLDPAKLWSRALAADELAQLAADLSAFAEVRVSSGRAVLSLVGDMAADPRHLQRVFGALASAGVRVLMVSQGASKHNCQLIVADGDAAAAVRAVHAEFFERASVGFA